MRTKNELTSLPIQAMYVKGWDLEDLLNRYFQSFLNLCFIEARFGTVAKHMRKEGVWKPIIGSCLGESWVVNAEWCCEYEKGKKNEFRFDLDEG